jgi:hypothetical protein
LLPQDYRGDYGQHFYNEQYMLAVYLFGGADGDKVVLPVCYISLNELRGALDNIWKHPTLEGNRAVRVIGGEWVVYAKRK